MANATPSLLKVLSLRPINNKRRLSKSAQPAESTEQHLLQPALGVDTQSGRASVTTVRLRRGTDIRLGRAADNPRTDQIHVAAFRQCTALPELLDDHRHLVAFEPPQVDSYAAE